MRVLVAIVSLLLALPAIGQVYKWTDPTGKVHYGDKPPEDAKKEELRLRIPSYEGPASKGISYGDVDVEKSEPAGRREFKELGGGGVPLIIVGDKVMRGFSAKYFEALAK